MDRAGWWVIYAFVSQHTCQLVTPAYFDNVKAIELIRDYRVVRMIGTSMKVELAHNTWCRPASINTTMSMILFGLQMLKSATSIC